MILIKRIGPTPLLPLLLALASGCHRGEEHGFPRSFLMGTAIAGFQVDMGCPTLPAAKCDDPNSDWYTWVTDPALVHDSKLFITDQPPGAGPGFAELYAQDLDRAANELHSNALRLSIEWSRVFPSSTVGVEGNDALGRIANPAALAYYHSVFAAMKARGLTPFVTLNHYTLPGWIHDAKGCHADLDHCSPRGWVDRDSTVHEAAKYAGFVAHEFGGEVDLWATLNEPFTAIVLSGYLAQTASRSNPPGVSLRWTEAKIVLGALEQAHAAMYDAVKANDLIAADGGSTPARVGLVYNIQASSPRDPKKPHDVQSAKDLSYLMNQVFLNAVIKGDVDEKLDGTLVHHPELASRMDFLGVNYYVRARVEGLGGSLAPTQTPYLTFDPTAVELDATDPTGMIDALALAKGYGVPLYISETGTFDPDDKGTAAQWIGATLTYVQRAMAAGADVRGYFYWTLMDNYEWNHAMSLRFGIYSVDANDPAKARRGRPLALSALARASQAHAVPADLAPSP